MELGCGVRVKAIKGHDYLYVWHYERDGARRRQVYDYIGPASDSENRRRAIDSLETDVHGVKGDLFPIPQSERDVNHNLTQNPGW